MASNQEIADQILNFTTEQFFAMEAKDFSPYKLRLAKQDFTGIAINAPKVIDLKRYQQLPVILAVQETSLRAWEVFRGYNSVLVACDLNSGEIRLHRLFQDKKLEYSHARVARPRPPKPQGDDAESRNTGMDKVEARDVLGLPWQRGKHSLAVIVFDWLSNQVQVELQGPGELSKPELRPVHPEPKPPAPPPPPGAAAPPQPVFPSYAPGPKTPQVKAGGIAFSVDPKALGARLAVYGGFSAKLKASWIPALAARHRLGDGREMNVVGVVPITFIAMALDTAEPRRFDWGVPIYGPAPLAEGAEARGCFAIDALGESAKNEGLSPGRYAAYLVVDGVVIGPEKFQILPL